MNYKSMRPAKQFLIVCCLVCSLIVVAGCGGSSNTPTPTPTPPTPSTGQIYVTLANQSQVVRFRAGDTGDASPQGRFPILSAPGPTFIAMDVPNDRLAIRSNDGTPAITFVDNASGIRINLGPLTGPRVITGASTTLGTKIGKCALDGTRDLFYVVQNLDTVTGTMLVFGPASTIVGDVAPLRTFTMTFHQGGFLLDAANDRLFVSDPVTNVISVFDNASTLAGPVVPARTISGAGTQLKSPGDMLLDSSGRLIVSNNPLFMATPQSSDILVFANAAVATGNIVPSASLTIPQIPSEMALSPAGDLYVVDGSPQVTVYGNIAAASGTVSPIRVITGPDTGLGFFQPATPALPLGIAVDTTR